MRQVFSVAPGVIWICVILALTLGAEWLATYFGGVAWVAPLVGLLTAVIVPILKVLAQGDMTPTARALDEAKAPPSKFKRWLL
jgi:ABC-type transport system involved in cytochrome c biogenesis permease component